ncbi:hypothetical protein NFC81_06655 [Salinispirillum sp. LH 10-3-1]|uniref:Transporter n=1 Tax=Salinispirillum sp. LH 10-3-1 TaxID=2952525 RepID=A0AB38YJ30_9GAMM
MRTMMYNTLCKTLLAGLLVLSPGLALANGIFQSTWRADRPAYTSFAVGAEWAEGRNIGNLPNDGRLLTMPRVQFNIPLGERGEIIIGHDVIRALSSSTAEATSGGDPYFFTKLGLFDETQYTPATTFIYGVVEPAANPPLGPDTLEFYAFLAFSKHWGDWRGDANFGTGIFEDHARSRQTDVVIMNLALWFQPAPLWHLGTEYLYQERVEGRWFDFTQGVDSPLRRRTLAATVDYGDQIKGRLRVSRGLVEQSEDWAVSTAVVYEFR